MMPKSPGLGDKSRDKKRIKGKQRQVLVMKRQEVQKPWGLISR
jgi:hypothetical protein